MPLPPPVIRAVRPSRRVGGTASDSGVDSSIIPAVSLGRGDVCGTQGEEGGKAVCADAVEQDVRQGIGVDGQPKGRLHMADEKGDVVLVAHSCCSM